MQRLQIKGLNSFSRITLYMHRTSVRGSWARPRERTQPFRRCWRRRKPDSSLRRSRPCSDSRCRTCKFHTTNVCSSQPCSRNSPEPTSWAWSSAFPDNSRCCSDRSLSSKLLWLFRPSCRRWSKLSQGLSAPGTSRQRPHWPLKKAVVGLHSSFYN